MARTRDQLDRRDVDNCRGGWAAAGSDGSSRDVTSASERTDFMMPSLSKARHEEAHREQPLRCHDQDCNGRHCNDDCGFYPPVPVTVVRDEADGEASVWIEHGAGVAERDECRFSGRVLDPEAIPLSVADGSG